MVRYVVLGGGVGGVTCAEELSRLATPADQVYLLSSSRILKIVTNVQAISKTTETFDLVPTDLDHYKKMSNFHVLQAYITEIDPERSVLVAADGTEYPYDKLCLATGARPNVLFDHPHVIGIRDIESVDELCDRLSRARRIMVVGNGGIALELLNEIRRVPMVWAIKDSYLGNTFLDAGASQFFMPHLFTRNEPLVTRILPQQQQQQEQQQDQQLSARAAPPPAGSAAAPRTLKQSLALRTAAASKANGGAASALTPSRKRRADGTPTAAAKAAADAAARTPGAALGPVWRTSLVVPPAPPGSRAATAPIYEATDRDLVIETEAHVVAVFTADEYRAARARAKRPRSANGSDDGTGGGGMGSCKSDDDEGSWGSLTSPSLAPSAAYTPITFIPHMGRFGEGRLGVVPVDEMDVDEEAAPFPEGMAGVERGPRAAAAIAAAAAAAAASTSRPKSPNSEVPRDGDATSPTTGTAPAASDSNTAATWPLYVRLSNNKIYGVDFLISATGVLPNSLLAESAGIATAGPVHGIAVNKAMRTSTRNVYAAGDCVHMAWHPRPTHWFQMRLWSQARLMGLQAARAMVRDAVLEAAVSVVGAGHHGQGPITPWTPPVVADGAYSPLLEGQASSSTAPPHASPPTTAPPVTPASIDPVPSHVHPSPGPVAAVMADGSRRAIPQPLDVHFELFAHVSRFFGFKVVLLGLFNAQGLVPGTYDVLVRSSHPGEYVKLVTDRTTHQLRGAMLIGETDLEEMFENMILTGTDVRFLEEVLMEPDMELTAPLFEDDAMDDFDDDAPFGGGSLFAPSVAGGGAASVPPPPPPPPLPLLQQQQQPQMQPQPAALLKGDVHALLAADFAAEAAAATSRSSSSASLASNGALLLAPAFPGGSVGGSAAPGIPVMGSLAHPGEWTPGVESLGVNELAGTAGGGGGGTSGGVGGAGAGGAGAGGAVGHHSPGAAAWPSSLF